MKVAWEVQSLDREDKQKIAEDSLNEMDSVSRMRCYREGACAILTYLKSNSINKFPLAKIDIRHAEQETDILESIIVDGCPHKGYAPMIKRLRNKIIQAKSDFSERFGEQIR